MNHITGLVAPVHTPMKADGSLDLGVVPEIVEHLARWNIAGLYPCGSTGEGLSLTVPERKAVAEAYADAGGDRMPVIVHVGHDSLSAARELAAHAQAIGADAIAMSPPSYFKPASVDIVVRCLNEVSGAAPDLPLYYYHIPALTGVHLFVIDLLRAAERDCPALAGVKFTFEDVMDLSRCAAFADGRYDILFGRDEMLLSGLVVGVKGAVGSTYNYAAPLYTHLIDAFDRGDLHEAKRLQLDAARLVDVVRRHGGVSCHKAMMKVIGIDCGPCRLPLDTLSPDEMQALEADLRGIGFFDWIG